MAKRESGKQWLSVYLDIIDFLWFSCNCTSGNKVCDDAKSIYSLLCDGTKERRGNKFISDSNIKLWAVKWNVVIDEVEEIFVDQIHQMPRRRNTMPNPLCSYHTLGKHLQWTCVAADQACILHWMRNCYFLCAYKMATPESPARTSNTVETCDARFSISS